MTKTFVAPLLLLALLLAACGGDDDEASEPLATGTNADATSASGAGNQEFHACSLFTGAELGDALGVEMNDGRGYLATARGATNCTWEGGVVIFVEVLLKGGEDWYETIHFPGASPDDVEEVDGIGDVAAWDDFVNVLDLVDGDRFISVQTLTGFSELDSKETAMEVAALALERLP